MPRKTSKMVTPKELSLILLSICLYSVCQDSTTGPSFKPTQNRVLSIPIYYMSKRKLKSGMKVAIHTRYRCFTWRYKSCSLHTGQKVSNAGEMTHITLIMFLVIPQETCLGLIVGPLSTPLPVPNTQQTDMKPCHWPWTKFLAVQAAKEFRTLVGA